MDVKCIGYGKQFHLLTLALFKQKRRLYEEAKIKIMLDELQNKGMSTHRWNNPTKKGTNVNFKAVKTPKEYKKKLEDIIKYTEGINSEMGFGFKINIGKESVGEV